MKYLCEFCDKILKDPLMDNSEDKLRYFCNKKCKKKMEEQEWEELLAKTKLNIEFIRMSWGLDAPCTKDDGGKN